MPNKMERFTQSGRRVLKFTQEETEYLEHSYIGTEHMLLGVLREEDSIAARVLRELGVDLDSCRMMVVLVSKAKPYISGSRLDLSAEMKKALELAVEESRQMGHHYVGTEQLLLGNIREDNIAVEVLRRFSVSREKVRHHMRSALMGSSAQGKQSVSSVEVHPHAIIVTSAQVLPDRTDSSPELPYFVGVPSATITLARAEAMRLKSKLVQPEHLLIALLRDENSQTGKLLRNVGVDPNRVLEQIQLSHEIASDPVSQAQMSPQLLKVLGFAAAASRESNDTDIRSEHLLLGLLRYKDNSAIDILKGQNVSLEELEKAARASLDGDSRQSD